MNQAESVESRTTKDLEGLLLSKILGKNVLKKETGGRFWKPIFKAAVESIGKPDRDPRIARYTSKCRLSTSYMKKGEDRAKFAMRPAVSDSCVGIVSSIMSLDIAGNEDLYLSVTGSLYF